MVHYPVPKYITKTALRNARDFAWSNAAKRADQVAVVATCMRCAQNLVKLPNDCEKTEERRCEHCKDGNRGGCTLVPKAMNGRLNRLYDLRTRYRNAVAAVPLAAARRNDVAIQAAGLKFARAQKQFNLELANRRRVAAHTGTPMGVATQVPTTSPQFLGLILHEQRRVASALEALAGLVPLLEVIAANHIPPAAADDAEDSDGSDDDDEGEEVAGDGGDDDEE